MPNAPNGTLPDTGAKRSLWQRLLAMGPTGPLLVFAMAGPLVGAALLVATTPHWLPWLAATGPSAMLFLGLGALTTAGCLLPTHATSLVAGFLFGRGLGSLLAWLCILAASTLGFWLWRHLVGERALRALADSPRGHAVHRALLGAGPRRAIGVIALLRLSPALPFAATNLLLAAFGVRGVVFVTATLLGITPRAIAVALVGAELSELDWQVGTPPWSTFVAIAATVLAMLWIGALAKRALRQVAGPLP
jgi:uncharacterized membrane protein YdjX (TVP38/TMEM64 family)